MFRHEEKLTLVPVKTFLKNSANIITAFKTGYTVINWDTISHKFFCLATGKTQLLHAITMSCRSMEHAVIEQMQQAIRLLIHMTTMLPAAVIQ